METTVYIREETDETLVKWFQIEGAYDKFNIISIVPLEIGMAAGKVLRYRIFYTRKDTFIIK